MPLTENKVNRITKVYEGVAGIEQELAQQSIVSGGVCISSLQGDFGDQMPDGEFDLAKTAEIIHASLKKNTSYILSDEGFEIL